MSTRDSVRQLRIPSPCSVSWDSMIGNDRVRFCEHCQLTVHNVNSADPKQIKRLIARSKGRLCVNYVQPVPPKPPAPALYKIGRRTSLIAASAFSATLSISSAVAATATVKPTALPNANEAAFTRRRATQSLTSGGSRLFGYVFDPNGALIAGAQVTLTNSETNEPFYSFTSADGQYQFEGLRPGTYHLKVSSKGFDTSDLPNLSVRVNDNNRIDQTLSIAPVEAEVTVTSETITLGGGAVAVVLPVEPLVKAAMEDDLDAVKTILLSHQDANTRDKGTQHTALDRAIMNGNREMVQVLLWAKADVNGRDGNGETPLMMIGEDTTSEIVWDLINNGAKVNLRDEDGDTALIAVAELENVEALKVLLDAGAKVNGTNNDGQTALMLAAENGKVHNVRALILAGADVNARDKDGKTALMLAKENDEPAVVRLLKAHGAIEFEAPKKE